MPQSFRAWVHQFTPQTLHFGPKIQPNGKSGFYQKHNFHLVFTYQTPLFAQNLIKRYSKDLLNPVVNSQNEALGCPKLSDTHPKKIPFF